jgi:hypothetical protein
MTVMIRIMALSLAFVYLENLDRLKVLVLAGIAANARQGRQVARCVAN